MRLTLNLGAKYQHKSKQNMTGGLGQPPPPPSAFDLSCQEDKKRFFLSLLTFAIVFYVPQLRSYNTIGTRSTQPPCPIGGMRGSIKTPRWGNNNISGQCYQRSAIINYEASILKTVKLSTYIMSLES